MNDTPKALVLADKLEVHDGLFVAHPAAAELRRLYEENEGRADRIQSIYKQLDATEKEVDDLRLLLKQALAAMNAVLSGGDFDHPYAELKQAAAAIRARLTGDSLAPVANHTKES